MNLIIDDSFVDLIDSGALERAVQAVFYRQAVPQETDLSIAVDDDERLRELNQEFLGINEPTDVLSFPSGEEQVDPETGDRYLGDIAISYPRAFEQANVAGHPVMAEIQLLAVHGVLHLLGYDHSTPQEKEEMWAVQADVIHSLGIQINRLPE